MAISVYTGPPGSGKTFALVSKPIVESVKSGRRVVTNIAGVSNDRVRRYVREKFNITEDRLGAILAVTREELSGPDAFPDEQRSDDHTIVKAGDRVIIDEWAMIFPPHGTQPNNIEGFLRWHRHLVDDQGRACDVIIATQDISDIARKYRGTVERSMHFKNLKSIGLAKGYVADLYEGHRQRRQDKYKTVNGRYRPEIFALYQSYETEGEAVEENADDRSSIFTRTTMIFGVGGLLAFVLALYFAFRFFDPSRFKEDRPTPSTISRTTALRPVPVRTSGLRIVGHVIADDGVRVLLTDDKGLVRLVRPEGFRFDGGRPVSGIFEGQEVVAGDRVYVETGNAEGLVR